MNRVRHLRGEFVERQSGDEADDALRDVLGDDRQIGVPQRRQAAETINATASALTFASVRTA